MKLIKARRTVDYCYGKNRSNLGANPTQSGQMSAISVFHYNMLHITYFHRHSPGGAFVVRLDGGICSTEWP